jgi:hypothetical protein
MWSLVVPTLIGQKRPVHSQCGILEESRIPSMPSEPGQARGGGQRRWMCEVRAGSPNA